MNCPKCKGYHLKPQKLDNGLIAITCDNCHGTLLSIIQYFQWREIQQIPDNQSNTICEIDETSQLLHCPKCTGFMTKYKISHQTHNRLDLCYRCYEVWIDSGEWQLLYQLDLQHNLENIFSEKWQKQMRDISFNQNQLVQSKKYFTEDFDKIHEIKQWLDNHPQKLTIINYLKH